MAEVTAEMADLGHLAHMLGRGIARPNAVEIVRSSDMSVASALHRTLVNSRDAITVLQDGCPVVMIGTIAGVLSGGEAFMWMTYTDDAMKSPVRFLKQSKRFFRYFTDRYNRLFNYSDAEHEAANRWLDWLGFKVDQANPVFLGAGKWPFYPFEWRAE